MMNKNYFRLFSNCIIVSGINRSTVCDIQRGKIFIIPNTMAAFVKELENDKFLNVLNAYSSKDQDIAKDYVSFLEKEELGFWTNEPERFPALETYWDTPEAINNAIIEMDMLSEKELKKILEELNALSCKFLELRFYEKLNLNILATFIKSCKNSLIRSIIIYGPFINETKLKELEHLVSTSPRISLLVLHSFEGNKNLLTHNKVLLINRKLERYSCGIIEPVSFAIKIPVFMEAQNHNLCLNRKVSIDIKGNIKNCPSMGKSYGNIKDTTLQEAIEHPDFKKLWNINKDKIDVCKVCEFRYVCTDCRAYVEKPEDIYSKPLKCGYNPYTKEWYDWTINPLKQKAISFYGMSKFVL